MSVAGLEGLPAAVLRELPTEPADVLAVAQQIAAYAFAAKAAQGDAEVAQCRTLLTQRQSEIRGLERRCDELEAELSHSRSEGARFAAQCERLSNEKAALVDSVKQLSKEVSKLDAFKRNVLKTLNDESVETVDHGRDIALGPAHLASHGDMPSAVKAFQAQMPGLGRPEAGLPGGIPDGKEFFRVARARLSPETFTAFLASIKSLNAHTRTRAQTLEDAQILFGQHNMDLYTQFESLLAAHLA